jgi:hypothetical protein
VQVPSVSPVSDTVLYLYYGNAVAADQQNRTGVWDSNYKGVWHLPNGTTLSAADSTGNGNNATIVGSVQAGTGQVGGGAGFVAANSSYIVTPSLLGGATKATLSGWYKRTALSNPVAFGGGNGVGVEFAQQATYTFAFLRNVLPYFYGYTTGPNDTGWHYAAVVFDATQSTASTQLTLYVDGVAQGMNYNGSAPASITGIPHYFGYDHNNGVFSNGSLDEIRISTAARTADTIKTEFNNQSAPGTFIAVGPQQSNGGGGTVSITVTSAPAGLGLTVDGAACAAAPCIYSWTPGSNHTIAVTTTPQAGGAGTQYVYASWSDGLAQSHSVTAPASPATYTANFTTQYQLTTSASAGGTISPGTGYYNSGAVVSVSATANGGFQFAGFSGALTGTTNPQNLTMSAPQAVTATFTSLGGGPTWYNAAWGFRKALTINHAQVSGTAALTNFPVLVSITDSNLQTGAQASGNDILFTAADGLTKLAHEIEKYSSVNGNLVAWVQVPSVSPVSDTVLYLYYGNAVAADQQNRTGVWDSNYKGVWHLPNGTTLTANDSTVNANHGIISGSVSAATGQIGGGETMTSPAQNARISTTASIGAGPFTVSAWANTSGGTANGDLIGDSNYSRMLAFFNNGYLFYGQPALNMPSPATGGWHHYVYLKTSSSSGTLYVDGVAVGTNSADSYTYGNLIIGNLPAPVTESLFGSIDEVRLSNAARTADTIKTEFNNQSSPATFIAVGPQQTNP